MIDLESIKGRIESYLESQLQLKAVHSDRLVDAMRYAVLGGGKRLRGTLVCATAVSLGARLQIALSSAAAVEFMHAYTLIHDDLPGMDDAATRRGKPSCHVAFGEAIAILAGDALQSMAFESIVNEKQLSADQRVEGIAVLSNACGWERLVGGQAMDIELENQDDVSEAQLNQVNSAKTGALFCACCELGAIAAEYGGETPEFRSVSAFAKHVGAAFQIVDDILDATTDSATLGKPAGADTTAGKRNYVSLLGIDEARMRAEQLLREGLACLADLDRPIPLFREVANKCVHRLR